MATTSDAFTELYLSGDRLWGDDFTPQQIDEWFADECEAYADLGGSDTTAEKYDYHGLNWQNGYRLLPPGRFTHALGVGSSFGFEFSPVLDRIDEITILEPSTRLRRKEFRGMPLRYVDPSPTGVMPFQPATFDLVVCFGVLHHIANVTKIVHEMGRVASPGGWVVIREPVISMGDWRSGRRPGLTKRERGIPRKLLEAALRDSGFLIKSSMLCCMPLSQRISRLVGCNIYASRLGAVIDRSLSIATAWNYRYHAVNSWQKLRPSSVFIVAQREWATVR
ncbi:class I SAM-dependent methyltransferase [Streptomyces sp. NPDC003758]